MTLKKGIYLNQAQCKQKEKKKITLFTVKLTSSFLLLLSQHFGHCVPQPSSGVIQFWYSLGILT